MTSFALISNRKSKYNLKNLSAVAALAENHGIHHRAYEDEKELIDALKALAVPEPEILIVNGGDGTVDMVVSAMRRNSIFKSVPALALLKGGTTNMTHNDLGLKGHPVKALKKLLQCPAIYHQIEREPLVVEQEGQPPLYGFFLGINAVPRAIIQTRRSFHSKGMTGGLGQILSLAGAIINFSRGKTKQDSILAAAPLSWSLDGNTWETEQNILMTVTTLEHLILGLGIKIADEKDSPALRVMSVGDNCKKAGHLLKSVTSTGIYPGVRKQYTTSVDIRGPFLWTLDGELYETNASDHIKIKTGEPLRFVRKKSA